jgi:putative hydrolase of the HAD superfamily
MVIVFDLDDTLYPEITYVYGGFSAVSRYLSPLLHLTEEDIFLELTEELKVQRTSVFDRFLEKKGVKNRSLVLKCLSIYRQHDPIIRLFPEAEACLDRLKNNYPLYVVTDGNKLVQKRKFLSLGLQTKVKKCFCTHAYGLQHGKPSPYCFQKICQLEQVNPSQLLYVADNPFKDFIGLKPLGFKTLRVLKGPYRDVLVESVYEAEWKISNLNELDQKLINAIFNFEN